MPRLVCEDKLRVTGRAAFCCGGSSSATSSSERADESDIGPLRWGGSSHGTDPPQLRPGADLLRLPGRAWRSRVQPQAPPPPQLCAPSVDPKERRQLQESGLIPRAAAAPAPQTGCITSRLPPADPPGTAVCLSKSLSQESSPRGCRDPLGRPLGQRYRAAAGKPQPRGVQGNQLPARQRLQDPP